jgi:uncharacterized protein
MEEKNYEKLIEKLYRVYESGDENELNDFYTEDVKIHTPDITNPSSETGIDYFKEQFRMYNKAFPKGTVDVTEVFTKGDKAIAVLSFKGKHIGEFFGIPASNKDISMTFSEMYKFKNGKISDYWFFVDNLHFMNQLGVISQKDIQEKLENR